MATSNPRVSRPAAIAGPVGPVPPISKADFVIARRPRSFVPWLPIPRRGLLRTCAILPIIIKILLTHLLVAMRSQPVNAVDPPTSSAQAEGSGAADLCDLLADLPFSDGDVAVVSESGRLSLRELRARVASLAATLREAQVRPGHPVGSLVAPGPSSVVAMFATWAVGAVYVPINRRFTAAEVWSFLAETPVALIIGAPDDLETHSVEIGVAA